MKKKYIIPIIMAILILITGVCFSPKPIVKSDDALINIYYYGSSINEQIDSDALTDMLGDAKMRLSLCGVPQLTVDEYPIEINILDGGKMKHLVMGKTNLCYIGNGGMCYTIQNGEELYREIIGMIQ